jgi:hypothetical protein
MAMVADGAIWVRRFDIKWSKDMSQEYSNSMRKEMPEFVDEL